MSVELSKTPAPQSGDTPCACRDCMDIAMSSDWTKPELCAECKDAQCSRWRIGQGADGPASWIFQCQRDDAYGDGCTCDYLKAQYDPAYRQCAFCASLEAER